ncbi:MAG: hypothetical protein ACI865_001914 [Flavobacteriaceae bacterium]|jgi:hypothetical protein
MRVRKYIVATIGISALMATSCKKHTVDIPEANNPVFRTDGTFDGEAFSLVAGDDNAYMFTMLLEENGVDLFTGKLSNGDFSVELGIYNGLVDFPTHQVIPEFPEDFNFSSVPTSPLLILDKDLFPNADLINEVIWVVDGIEEGSDDVEIYAPGVYQVTAMITFNDLSTNTLSSQLIVGYKRHADFQIKHYLNQNGAFSAWVDDPSVPIEKVEWYLNDSLISSLSEIGTTLAPMNYNLRADVYFENRVVRSKSMIIDGSLSGKFIDDLSIFEMNILILQHQDFNIRVKIEKDNETYSSAFAVNNSNNVQITSIEYFGKNSSGEDVYKLGAHIVANVAIVNGGDAHEVEFDAVLGVAIPKD